MHIGKSFTGKKVLSLLTALATTAVFLLFCKAVWGSDLSQLQLTVVSENEIRLDWSGSLDKDYEFIVERKRDSGSYIEMDTVTEDESEYEYEDDTLSSERTYTYRVRLVDSSDDTVLYTNEVTVNTLEVETPDSLEAVTLSSSRIDLEWSYPGSKGYDTVIERRSSGRSWSVIANLPKGTFSYSDTEISADKSYYYRIKAVSGSFISSEYHPESSNGIKAATSPNSPEAIYAYAVSDTEICLKWDNPTTDTYIIERKGGDDEDFFEIDTVDSSSEDWVDSGLSPNTLYTYRLKAVSDIVEDTLEYSKEIAITTTYLKPPSSIAALYNSGSGVNLTWNDNSDNETGFEIWRKTEGEDSWTKYTSAERNAESFTDAALSEDTRYSYRVRASIPYKNSFSAFTEEAEVKPISLKQPDRLDYEVVSSGDIKLTWKDSLSGETGFRIERREGLDEVWTAIANVPANTESYTCTGLNSYTRYFFRVTAFNNYKYYSAGIGSSIEVIPGKPHTPSNVKAEALSGRAVKLTWTDNSINESGFRIERRMKGQGFSTIANAAPNATDFTDTNLDPAKAYYYRITAYNKSGGSSYEKEANVVTKAGVSFSDIKSTFWARDMIEDLAGRGIFKSKAAGRFGPNDAVTRGEFANILVRAFTVNKTAAGSYLDVNAGHLYYEEIITASKMGFFPDTGSKYFYPDRAITREDMAIYLVRALKSVEKPLPSQDTTVLDKYSDRDKISPGAIASLASMCGERLINGTSSGSKRLIEPRRAITRAEAAVVIYNTLLAIGE